MSTKRCAGAGRKPAAGSLGPSQIKVRSSRTTRSALAQRIYGFCIFVLEDRSLPGHPRRRRAAALQGRFAPGDESSRLPTGVAARQAPWRAVPRGQDRLSP
jgi:hypothetical protein